MLYICIRYIRSSQRILSHTINIKKLHEYFLDAFEICKYIQNCTPEKLTITSFLLLFNSWTRVILSFPFINEFLSNFPIYCLASTLIFEFSGLSRKRISVHYSRFIILYVHSRVQCDSFPNFSRLGRPRDSLYKE